LRDYRNLSFFNGGPIFSKKGEKILIFKAKKFGGNVTTLIFALPKRNKGSEEEGSLGINFK
jgi:hypothetical protein